MRIRSTFWVCLFLAVACTSDPDHPAEATASGSTAASGNGAGGAGAAAGSTGTGNVCEPGSEVDCTCPDGTPSTRTCDADGQGLGDCGCEGQGGSGGNGGSGGTSGDCRPGDRSECYEGPAGTLGVGVCAAGTYACDPDGRVWSRCQGQVLPSDDLCDTDVDEDCNGSLVPCLSSAHWQRGFPGITTSLGGLAVDPAGNVLVTATDLENPASGVEAHVIKLSPYGQLLWDKEYVVSSGTVAVDAAGNVYFAGYAGSAFDLGAGQMGGNAPAVFVLKLDPAGSYVWSKVYLSLGLYDGVYPIAFDGAGALYVGGNFQGSVDLDGQVLSAPGFDGFVLKLDTNGNQIWAKALGATEGAEVASLDVGPGGVLAITGFYQGEIFDALESQGLATDVFLAKVDAGGGVLWARSFGDPVENDYTESVSVSSAGEVALTGGLLGEEVDFGAGPLFADHAYTGYVASFAANGSHLWSQLLGDDGPQGSYAALALPGGAVQLVGGLDGNGADVGGTLVSANGYHDVLVAELSTAGAAVDVALYGDSDGQYARRTARPVAGGRIVTGGFWGSLDFGAGTGPMVDQTVNGTFYVAKVPD